MAAPPAHEESVELPGKRGPPQNYGQRLRATQFAEVAWQHFRRFPETQVTLVSLELLRFRPGPVARKQNIANGSQSN